MGHSLRDHFGAKSSAWSCATIYTRGNYYPRCLLCLSRTVSSHSPAGQNSITTSNDFLLSWRLINSTTCGCLQRSSRSHSRSISFSIKSSRRFYGTRCKQHRHLSNCFQRMLVSTAYIVNFHCNLAPSLPVHSNADRSLGPETDDIFYLVKLANLVCR
jgi:hypothetical protein